MNKEKMLELLVCPLCHGKLELGEDELICRVDKLAFPIVDDIPRMIVEDARELT